MPDGVLPFLAQNGIDSEWYCDSGDATLIYDIANGSLAVAIIALGLFAAYRSSLLVDRYNEGKTIAFAMHNAGESCIDSVARH